MFEELKFEYTVRTCPTDDSEGLEEMLNDMASEGWELYSLNEAENEEGEFQYLCIFSRKANGHSDFDEDYSLNAGDFKNTMKRLLNKKDDLYKECRELQQQIKEKNLQINEIKNLLDSAESVDRESLNEEISDKMGELNSLKSKFSELLSPSSMFSRINQELLTIVVSHELLELIDTERDGDLIAESVKLRQNLTDKYGYVIPRIHFSISDEMNEHEYGINVRGLRTVTGVVYPENRRFFIGESNIEEVPDGAIEDIDTVNGQKVFWLDEKETKDFWDNGLTPSQVIISHLEFVVRKYVDEILSYKDILSYIALLEDGNAFLAEDLFQKNISLGDLRYIFANLIREKVSVKDIVYVFEKLNDISTQELNNEKLLRELRYSLRRQICGSVADNNNVIYVISIPKKFRKILPIILKQKENGELKDFIDYITGAHNNSQASVLISEPRYRKDLFNLFENIIPELAVLSEDEITDEFTLEES